MRRSAIAWYTAALLPLSLLGLLYIALLLQDTWRQAEDGTVDRARSALARIDTRLERELAAISVAARLGHAAAEDLGEWYLVVAKAYPQWRAFALADVSTGKLSWFPAASTPPARLTSFDWAGFAGAKAQARFDGVERTDGDCLCIAIYQRLFIGDAAFVLMLVRDAADLRESLTAQAQPGEVVALVDRAGNFVARTLANASRAGTPATRYVREASARGGEGVYSGVTFEGVHNRTAYATSDLTGWSVHIAVPAASYNLLSTGYTAFALLAVLMALAFAGGVTWYGVRDLQAARQQERARLQSYKLEAVGALSSAIVHDFNNLLAIMRSCLQLLTTAREPDEQALILKEGLLALDRGSALVNQLLSFVRDKPLEIACVDLGSTVQEVGDLLRRTLGADRVFNLGIAPDAQFVRTNESQLELVLLNLAANARDAMPTGGTFSISRASRPPPAASISSSATPASA